MAGLLAYAAAGGLAGVGKGMVEDAEQRRIDAREELRARRAAEEAQRGRDFTAGENRLNRDQQTALQNDRQAFETGQSEADRKFRSSEAQADRGFRAGESERDRAFRSGEAEKDRTFRSTEASNERSFKEAQASLDRDLRMGLSTAEIASREGISERELAARAGLSERELATRERIAREDREFRGAEAEKDRTFRGGEAEKDRTFRGSESAADRTLRSDEAQRDRDFRSGEAAADRAFKRREREATQGNFDKQFQDDRGYYWTRNERNESVPVRDPETGEQIRGPMKTDASQMSAAQRGAAIRSAMSTATTKDYSGKQTVDWEVYANRLMAQNVEIDPGLKAEIEAGLRRQTAEQVKRDADGRTSMWKDEAAEFDGKTRAAWERDEIERRVADTMFRITGEAPPARAGQPAASSRTDLPAAPRDPAQRKIGQTYLAPDGRKVEWTDRGWRVVQ